MRRSLSFDDLALVTEGACPFDRGRLRLGDARATGNWALCDKCGAMWRASTQAGDLMVEGEWLETDLHLSAPAVPVVWVPNTTGIVLEPRLIKTAQTVKIWLRRHGYP